MLLKLLKTAEAFLDKKVGECRRIIQFFNAEEHKQVSLFVLDNFELFKKDVESCWDEGSANVVEFWRFEVRGNIEARDEKRFAEETEDNMEQFKSQFQYLEIQKIMPT